MPTTSVTVRLNASAITALLRSTTDAAAGRAANRVVPRVRNNFERADRHLTGAMAASIHAVRTRQTTTTTTYAVTSPLRYTGWQERGIGPVHARPGGVLRFRPKGSSVFIFRKSTRGFPGANAFRDAISSVRISDFLP